MTVGETTESTAESRPAKIGRPDKAGLAALSDTTTRIRRAVESVIEGKRDVVRLALTVMLAEGHLLIEDVPGVGKTMLAKALARSIDCSVRRIQFTPDLLPSDITGVSIYNQERRDFEFKPGADLRQHRRRRRDQPRLAEDPVGAAGVHGGAAGHRRRRDLRARHAVHGASRRRTRSRWRAPTPSPRRSATGSWPGCRWATRTSRPSWQMLDTHGQTLAAGRPRAGRRRHRDRRADRDRARRARLRPGPALRRRPGDRHPQLPRPPARRLAARDAAPDPRRPGGRGARRPRLRAARRRPGPRRAGARPPAAADRRGADRPALAPRRSSSTSWPRVPAARRRPAEPAELPSSARRAPGPDHPRPRPSSPPGSPSWSPPSRLGQRDLLRVGVLLARAAAGRALVVARTRYRLSSPPPARPGRGPPPARRRAVTLRLDNVSRLPTGLLLVEDQVPYVLGLAAAVRPRPGRAARPARGHLRGALGRPRPLHARAADDPADRPVRHVRAAAVVHGRDTLVVTPPVQPLPAVALSAASGPAAARAGPGRSPAPARTTSPPASTATATTCAGCTGAPPRGSAS